MEFTSETLQYLSTGFSPNYKHFNHKMNKLQILIDTEDELEYFKEYYWEKAQESSKPKGFNSVFAIIRYRVDKIRMLDMSYDEFLQLYNQDRMTALRKLFLEPMHKAHLKLLDEKLGDDSIKILFNLHKLNPTRSLLRLINQNVTVKERYERDLEEYKKGRLELPEESHFLESNAFYPKFDNIDGNNAFEEGKKTFKQHFVRERNPQVIRLAKKRFKDRNGRLFCEVCGFDFYEKYGEIGQDFIEGHHTVPVSELKDGDVTRVADIDLVCSNCHSMLHSKKTLLSKEELKRLIDK
ncbi:HNH endonuclease [Terribacillus sp. JSM ZJ617]|uniref:HNH endonuclease n=1 Tax=Terribacillus sp. JSM ZJ617 TaxID=3342119 RepID=UPI0035A8721A